MTPADERLTDPEDWTPTGDPNIDGGYQDFPGPERDLRPGSRGSVR